MLAKPVNGWQKQPTLDHILYPIFSCHLPETLKNSLFPSLSLFFVDAPPSDVSAHIVKLRERLTKSLGCWFLLGPGTLQSGLLH